MSRASATPADSNQLRLAAIRPHAIRWRRQALAAARDPVYIALALIVLAGAALRVLISLRWEPAFLGFPDSSIYVGSAHTGLFQNPLRVTGYAEFMRLMHGIRPHLAFLVRVQHLLGIASGLLLFGAVRRAGLPRALGLAPAAVVILGGSELFIEHAVLTEALFIFLVDLAIYALVRSGARGWAWAPLAGLALGCATDVRSLGLVLLPCLALVSLLLWRKPWRMRVLSLALIALAAAVPITWYLVAHQDADGYGGFTGAGYFDLYARVAPFADCNKFHPPSGTARLCIHLPVSKRPGHDAWEFTAISPAVAVYGEPDEHLPMPGENSQLKSFAEAAILGQPGDYLEYVGRDLIRIFDPSFPSSPFGSKGPTGEGYGAPPQQLAEYYFVPSTEMNVERLAAGYYTDGTVHRDMTFLRSWERDTRLEGPVTVLLVLLALLAPIVAREHRRAALLFLVATVVLLVAPIFLSEYDYRFTIPAFGPLAASAAIGGWGLAGAVSRRLRRARPHSA